MSRGVKLKILLFCINGLLFCIKELFRKMFIEDFAFFFKIRYKIIIVKER